MKQLLIVTLVLLGTTAFMSGCERNDYQHPLHRSK